MADPSIDIRGGLAWFVGLLCVGGAAVWVQTFQPDAGRAWLLLGTYLLAYAPLVALERAYRRVRSVSYAPRGLEERGVIGGRWMLATCALHALGPSAFFVWGGRRALAGAVVTALWALSWFAYLEVQRRTRRPLEPGAWTSREIDHLRVNVEALAIVGIWVTAGLLAEVVAPTGSGLVGWLIGLAALGVAAAFARVIATLVSRGSLAGFLVVAYAATAVGLTALASPWVWQVYVGLGVPVIAILAERARRRRALAVARGLASCGHAPELRRRYGTEFAV